MRKGVFVISLDFELHWGVSETRTVEMYKENLNGVRPAIHQMLELFKEYEVHATWATVGFLFCKNKTEILSCTREGLKPPYQNSKLSNYHLIKEIGFNHYDDPYHYGDDILDIIRGYPGQEIGTHTFSHYYCLEEGQTPEHFEQDIVLAKQVADQQGLKLHCIVFPRNQYSKDYLRVCLKQGIRVYRGNSGHWLYKSLSSEGQHLIRRGFRLLDTYLPLSGSITYPLEHLVEEGMINVPASRFLRPFTPRLKFFERIRLKRIKSEMNKAAQKGQLYHLWWHPHNFGRYTEGNISFLNQILEHFCQLKQQYGFTSLNMFEVANLTQSETYEPARSSTKNRY